MRLIKMYCLVISTLLVVIASHLNLLSWEKVCIVILYAMIVSRHFLPKVMDDDDTSTSGGSSLSVN